jgi:hypothetical protein
VPPRVNDRQQPPILAREIKRIARRVLPLMLVPCVPAVVACASGSFPFQADRNPAVPDWIEAKGEPPPLLLRPLSESEAVALNRRIPFSAEPGPPAAPFVLRGDGTARARAVECLTSAIYYEAASEAAEGQAAVAQVILNRMRHPAFPASVCAVVYQGSTLPTGCQFSYTCDGSLRRLPSRLEWDRARAIAEAALSGAVMGRVGLATHYHTEQVVPYWAPSLAKSVQLGPHIFYRWAGGPGRPRGFTQHYSGKESDPLTLRRVALISHDIWPSAGDMVSEPRLSVAIDPETELNGIVHVLASAPNPSQGAYEKAIRAHFGGETARPLLRRLGGPGASADEAEPRAAPEPPAKEPETLDDKLLSAAATIVVPPLEQVIREFGREMRLPAFLRAQRRLYKASAEHAQRLAERAALDWEIYSGAPVGSQKAILSPAQGLNDGGCLAATASGSGLRVIRWPDDPRSWGPADIFLASGFADDGLRAADGVPKRKARELRAVIEPIEAQVVAAVFARVAALSRGEATGRAILRREVAQGHTLVPLLARRLRFYERHRADYPTLGHFLPALVAGFRTPKDRDEATAKPTPAAQVCGASPA